MVLRGKSFNFFEYGAKTNCAPQCATGITGAFVASAIRAAPVFPSMGQRSGSLVSVPSGLNTTASPFSTAAMAPRTAIFACRDSR